MSSSSRAEHDEPLRRVDLSRRETSQCHGVEDAGERDILLAEPAIKGGNQGKAGGLRMAETECHVGWAMMQMNEGGLSPLARPGTGLRTQ
ncbi:hypothetical protein L209DRAFT_247187 [Thermothelomyces heterothallicus CBS 203.75]